MRITGISGLLGNLKSGFLLMNTGTRLETDSRSCKYVVVTPSLGEPLKMYLTTAAVTHTVLLSCKNVVQRTIFISCYIHMQKTCQLLYVLTTVYHVTLQFLNIYWLEFILQVPYFFMWHLGSLIFSLGF